MGEEGWGGVGWGGGGVLVVLGEGFGRGLEDFKNFEALRPPQFRFSREWRASTESKAGPWRGWRGRERERRVGMM